MSNDPMLLIKYPGFLERNMKRPINGLFAGRFDRKFLALSSFFDNERVCKLKKRDRYTYIQGTTLGAMSFTNDERGMAIKGGKRHPAIDDNVTIYAGATIPGDVTVCTGCVLGGIWMELHRQNGPVKRKTLMDILKYG